MSKNNNNLRLGTKKENQHFYTPINIAVQNTLHGNNNNQLELWKDDNYTESDKETTISCDPKHKLNCYDIDLISLLQKLVSEKLIKIENNDDNNLFSGNPEIELNLYQEIKTAKGGKKPSGKELECFIKSLQALENYKFKIKQTANIKRKKNNPIRKTKEYTSRLILKKQLITTEYINNTKPQKQTNKYIILLDSVFRLRDFFATTQEKTNFLEERCKTRREAFKEYEKIPNTHKSWLILEQYLRTKSEYQKPSNNNPSIITHEIYKKALLEKLGLYNIRHDRQTDYLKNAIQYCKYIEYNGKKILTDFYVMNAPEGKKYIFTAEPQDKNYEQKLAQTLNFK